VRTSDADRRHVTKARTRRDPKVVKKCVVLTGS
jgi:hypothetical protein